MPAASSSFEEPARLRQSALSRLSMGLPAASGRRSAHDALSVLHELAAVPADAATAATATNALAVLHALQVHRVEQEVQQE